MSIADYSVVFQDPRSWSGGPLFEVHVLLPRQSGMVHATEMARLLWALGLRLPTDDTLRVFVLPDALRRTSDIDWKRHVWELDADTVVGVQVFVSGDRELQLAIPPVQWRRLCPSFPWNWNDVATQDAIGAHRKVVAKIRSAHRVLPVQAALLQDESWTWSLRDTDTGILVAASLVPALGEGVLIDDSGFARLDLITPTK